jgi:hypothetical protein
VVSCQPDAAKAYKQMEHAREQQGDVPVNVENGESSATIGRLRGFELSIKDLVARFV